MTTILFRCARVGLLFALAATVIGGHAALARLLFAGAGAPPAAAGITSVAASLVVFLVTGIFFLPRAKQLAGASAEAVTIAVGTALTCVAARAAVEAIAGSFVGGLPILAMALTAAIVGSARPVAVRRSMARARVMPGPRPARIVDRRAS